ncbi:PLP-dependent aminotransferase family protein [Cognatishimia sp. WU-CL00825]|uniref:MocR-like pyridoxine biosynthesis transcription factor PdxR n=1 Tax=Cognatishimia sp. WU-CL00825 TaxID=3127658 RepID=UPI0031072597
MPAHSLTFAVDRASKTPVFEQICMAVRRHVQSGPLLAGQKLPPTRSLAIELGVSRTTVVTAYDQLVAEGYILGRPGAGYEICDTGALELGGTLAKPLITTSPAMATTNPAAPFRAGEPDMRLFPHRAWGRTVARVFRSAPVQLGSDDSLIGHQGLRRAIADHIAEWRGVEAHCDQVIVTAGASDALELCLRCLAQAGDTIAVEDPGYRPLKHFIADRGLTLGFMATDTQGAILPKVKAKAAILTPSHQYPLGGTMSLQRRQSFLSWAQRQGSWLIEDDYDSEFRFAGRPIPALAGFDGLQRSIYIGSFSKIFSNELRMGYVVVPKSLQARFVTTLRRFGRKASQMPQAPLADFMQSGEFYRHLRRVRRIYGKRRAFLLGALQDRFQDVGWFTDHHAGMQIAFHLNIDLPDTNVMSAGRKAGLDIEALSGFCSGPAKCNGILLGYCGFDEQELDKALGTLRQVIDAQKERAATGDPFPKTD